MSESKISKFMCNLCGASKEKELGRLPLGWLNMLIENPMLDRYFTEKHICADCVKDICKRGKLTKEG